MLVFSSQRTGGSPLGAMPVASGPRHWCQLSSASVETSPAQAEAETDQTQKVTSASFFMAAIALVINNGPYPPARRLDKVARDDGKTTMNLHEPSQPPLSRRAFVQGSAAAVLSAAGYERVRGA